MGIKGRTSRRIDNFALVVRLCN